MGRLGVVGHVFETNRGDWGEEGHRGAHVAFTLGRVDRGTFGFVPCSPDSMYGGADEST